MLKIPLFFHVFWHLILALKLSLVWVGTWCKAWIVCFCMYFQYLYKTQFHPKCHLRHSCIEPTIYSLVTEPFSRFREILFTRVFLLGFKGCEIGPLLVLVSPCFRENVVVTCKIGAFLCSLDTLLQKNVIVFFFGNQISKWCSYEKRLLLAYFSQFFSHQGKLAKIPSARILFTYIHVFCSPYWLFLPYQLWKKYEFIRYGFSLVWFLALILIRAIVEQSINNKMESKTFVGMSTTDMYLH